MPHPPITNESSSSIWWAVLGGRGTSAWGGDPRFPTPLYETLLPEEIGLTPGSIIITIYYYEGHHQSQSYLLQPFSVHRLTLIQSRSQLQLLVGSYYYLSLVNRPLTNCSTGCLTLPRPSPVLRLVRGRFTRLTTSMALATAVHEELSDYTVAEILGGARPPTF